MPLVAIVLFASLLGPAGINVLMTLLVRIVIPKSIAFPFLDGGVLFTRVVLLGSLHECGIYYLALIETEALAI